MKKSTLLATLLLTYLLGAGAVSHAQDNPEVSQPTQAWNFQVFLDKKPIGSQTFVKSGSSDNYEMRIEADLKVKILFITAYTYEHRNRELWRDNCLQSIEATTNDGGDMFAVQGRLNGDVFEVVANEKPAQLPPCITSFAYWDPRFLTQTFLLNSQTGEYMPVEITGPFPETRIDRGSSMPAQRYRIIAKDVDIQLWYSQAGDWLALESAVEGDRTLRYERI